MTDVSRIADTRLSASKHSVLIHGGIWARAPLEEIARGYANDAEIRFETHTPGNKASLLTQRFDIHRCNSMRTELPISSEELDWIARCRYLRALPKTKAVRYLRAMRRAWDDVLERWSIDAAISETIDSYVISTLENACRARGVPFIGLVTCFVDGYCRITSYGEHTIVREPDETEVEQVLDALTKPGYRPEFVRSNARMERRAFIAWTRNIGRVIYWGLAMLNPAQRLRNHCVGAFVTSRRNLHLWPRMRLGDVGWRTHVANSPLPSIFVPLQMFPEATIDYWCQNLTMLHYEDVLVDLVRRYDKDFQFVLKEHPNLLGWRSPRLYERLESLPNVIFVPTDEPIESIVTTTDGVLIWTGSVGFQAALRGKPVFSLSDVYFISGERFHVISGRESGAELSQCLHEIASCRISRDEQRTMVRHMLAGLIPGRLSFGRHHASPEAERCAEYRALGGRIAALMG